MKHRRLLLAAAVGAMGVLTAFSTAQAQNWPTKPVSLIVPFTAGGPTDSMARTLSVALTKSLGQSVIVENKPGAGGTIASQYVAKAAPDGYTFLIHHNGMASAPALYRKLKFNPLADYEYISLTADVPMTLLGRKDFPPNNFKELTAHIQQNKDKVNLANAGLGAVSHLCGMLLQQALGVNLTTVPFQGTGPAMNALLGGQVDVMCDQTTNTVPHIKANSVKFYGVTTKQRIKALPDAPTLSEQGLKDFEMVVWHGIYAPKGTPKDVVMKMNGAVRNALKSPDVQKRLAELGAEIVPENKQTPEALQAWLKSEIDRLGPLIKQAGTFAD